MSDSTHQRHLNTLSAYYFACFAALGSIVPFASLFFTERGLTASQFGRVMFLFPVANIVVPPIWGLLADRFHARVGLLRIATLTCVPAVLLLLPDAGLIGALLGMGAYSAARAPLVPLADAVAHEFLGEARSRFAYVRAWGSVGFALAVIAAGQLETNRSPLAFVAGPAVLYAFAALAACAIPRESHGPLAKEREPDVLGRALRHIRSSGLVLLLLGHVVYAMAHSMFDAFFALHARNLGASDSFIGFAWGIGVTCEVLLMFAAPPFLRRFRATTLLLIAAFVATGRWSLMAILTNPDVILFIQPLHAVTFGLWYLAMVKLIQERTEGALRATVQSFAMMAMGVGMAFGALLGGELMEHHGGSAVFTLGAAMALIAGVFYGALRRR